MEAALPIIIFFLIHWWGSVFMQTFYLHRYASHGMFTMSKGWERFFYFLTWFFQGSSFLNPRAYAWMHREHHAYSDTDKDPHSPHFYRDAFSMMWQTKGYYNDYVFRRKQTEPRFQAAVPEWALIDRIGDNWITRVAFGTAYTLFYIAYAPHWAFFALLPIHYLMGPVHGAIVNWCGHKYGYRNFNTRDQSVNGLPIDFLTLGELFQNNHHRYGQAPKFAQRAWEVDPAWPVIKLFHALGIINLDQKPIHLEDNPPLPDPRAEAEAAAAAQPAE